MSLCVTIDLKMSVMSPKGPAAFPLGMRVMVFTKSLMSMVSVVMLIGLFLEVLSVEVIWCLSGYSFFKDVDVVFCFQYYGRVL